MLPSFTSLSTEKLGWCKMNFVENSSAENFIFYLWIIFLIRGWSMDNNNVFSEHVMIIHRSVKFYSVSFQTTIRSSSVSYEVMECDYLQMWNFGYKSLEIFRDARRTGNSNFIWCRKLLAKISYIAERASARDNQKM